MWKINISGNVYVGIINDSYGPISVSGNALVNEITCVNCHISLSKKCYIDKINLSIGHTINIVDNLKAKGPMLIHINSHNKAIKNGKGVKLLEISNGVNTSDVLSNFKLDSSNFFINSNGNIDIK